MVTHVDVGVVVAEHLQLFLRKCQDKRNTLTHTYTEPTRSLFFLWRIVRELDSSFVFLSNNRLDNGAN